MHACIDQCMADDPYILKAGSLCKASVFDVGSSRTSLNKDLYDVCLFHMPGHIAEQSDMLVL